MPNVHPFTDFMEYINVKLEVLYSDGSGQRAGSHALHALAVVLQNRGKFDASDGSCYYACCIAGNRSLGPPTSLAK